ncbi:MAG: RNA polymerase sigma-70 factor [Flavitalea sp.]
MNKTVLHNEKMLLASVAGGDEEAFRVLYDHYGKKALTIARKMLHAEAEAMDVLQEVFIKIWINRGKLSQVDNFSAYFNAITRNYLFNVLRKKLNEQSVLTELTSNSHSAGADKHDPVTIRQLRDVLNNAIHKLPPRQQTVFELSRLEGLKQEDIAARLQISRETVKRHLAEAVRNLRSMLASETHVIVLLLVICLH